MKECSARELQRAIRAQGNKERAKLVGVFFKTGKGQYAEGDIFLGLTVPQVRAAIRPYRQMPLREVDVLLASKYHEERLAALVILVHQSQRGDDEVRGKLCAFYLKRTKQINNWDLVDLAAPFVVGGYLYERPRAFLYRLARSPNLWERRTAIVATYYFIRQGDVDDTFALAEALLHDDEDLIHKAVGGGLRWAGDSDPQRLLAFLDKHAAVMPRVMLRYAIEHLSAAQRAKYMKAKDKG